MSRVTPRQAVPALVAPSRFAADRLLRLQDVIRRRRNAERLLYGSDRTASLALLDRAIVSLYGDCREAGVEDDALRLLLRSRETVVDTLSVVA